MYKQGRTLYLPFYSSVVFSYFFYKKPQQKSGSLHQIYVLRLEIIYHPIKQNLMQFQSFH